MFAVGFDTMLHDGQQGLHEACDARAAPNVLHGPVHVIRAASDNSQGGYCTQHTGQKVILSHSKQRNSPQFLLCPALTPVHNLDNTAQPKGASDT